MSEAAANAHNPRTRLPDFCSWPVLFALLLLAALVVLIMLLAPGSRMTLTSLGTGMLFAVWLAVACGVALCKLRTRLERLQPLAAYAVIWCLILGTTLLGSIVVWWLDQNLATGLTPLNGRRFLGGNLAVAALVGAALLRYFYVLAQWREGVEATAEARVEALQARIRPHFLFNSMNTVAALVRLDPAAAERTVEDLSQLFRAALGNSEQAATLGDELELVDRYLAIEQLRLGERLQVLRELHDVPQTLPLPRLLLQPLAENAVLHGIQNCRQGGTVRLACHRAGDKLHIEIANSRCAEGASRHHGTGRSLSNVAQRLRHHYGDQARLDVYEGAHEYRVEVSLPLPGDLR